MTSITAALRASLLDQRDFRRLSNQEAKRLIDDATVIKTIGESVVWTVRWTRSGRPVEVRTNVVVVNSMGERLAMNVRILVERPWQSHWILTWGSKTHHEHPEQIRRLDLRDDHRNPNGTNWQRQTHKHLWSVEDGNAAAYTPHDIPHDPATPPVGPDDYRAIFEAFAREVHIEFAPDYVWEDPPIEALPEGIDPTLWEVP
jgi:hypothetical protein